MITISLIEHRNQERIRIDCKKEQETINKIKKIDGRRWSASKRCWHIPYQKTAYNQLQKLFGKKNININSIKAKNIIQGNTPVNKSNIKILKPKLIYYKYNDNTYFTIGGEIAIVNKDKTKTNYINVYIPKHFQNWIAIVKKIVNSQWIKEEKFWRLPLYKDTIDQLNQIPNIHYNFEIPQNLPDLPNTHQNDKTRKKTIKLNSYQIKALTVLEEKLTLERKSWRTIKGYKTYLRGLFRYYPNTKPSKITNQQIQKYLLYKIKHDNIKEATQGQFINAIVAFYKRILGQEVKLEGLQRPKKVRSLPNVFAKEEVAALLNCIDNVKHKSMLAIIYSAGLRKSEVINLRKRDILFQRNCIFVKGGKGKKDRYVLLANKAKEVIKIYLSIYHPRYWLFEGQKGGQYGDRSLQSVFAKAKEISNVNPYVTLHGLRHSFATHLVENGIPLHVIKDLLGHNNIKTTEVYIHISNKYRQKLQSPLDYINFDIDSSI